MQLSDDEYNSLVFDAVNSLSKSLLFILKKSYFRYNALVADADADGSGELVVAEFEAWLMSAHPVAKKLKQQLSLLRYSAQQTLEADAGLADDLWKEASANTAQKQTEEVAAEEEVIMMMLVLLLLMRLLVYLLERPFLTLSLACFQARRALILDKISSLDNEMSVSEVHAVLAGASLNLSQRSRENSAESASDGQTPREMPSPASSFTGSDFDFGGLEQVYTQRLLVPAQQLPAPAQRLPAPAQRQPAPARRLPAPSRRLPAPA